MRRFLDYRPPGNPVSALGLVLVFVGLVLNAFQSTKWIVIALLVVALVLLIASPFVGTRERR